MRGFKPDPNRKKYWRPFIEHQLFRLQHPESGKHLTFDAFAQLMDGGRWDEAVRRYWPDREELLEITPPSPDDGTSGSSPGHHQTEPPAGSSPPG